jgi:hypothetical protein
VERKTTGIRCTDAPPIAVDLSTGKQSGRIFTQEDGSWLHPGKVSDLFERLAAAAGLPPVRLHDVRHGAATLMLSAGFDIKVVSGIEPFAHGHFGVEALADSEAATGCTRRCARHRGSAQSSPPSTNPSSTRNGAKSGSTGSGISMGTLRYLSRCGTPASS